MAGTPEQQVQKLNEEYQRRLAEIKAQTPKNPEAGEPQAEADHILAEHRAVSETAEKMIQAEVPEFKVSSHDAGRSAGELSEENRQKVQSWVNAAVDNPAQAVQMAKASGDIALIDVFHDVLTSDQAFLEMVKRGKIRQLAA
jgi:hypothetical protein